MDKFNIKLDGQIHRLKSILKEKPDDVSVLMAYAEACRSRGSRLEALKAYQKIIKIKPDLPEVRCALANIYFHMDHFRDALIEIKKIFLIDPRNVEAHLLLKKIDIKFGIPADLKADLKEHLSFKTSPRRIEKIKKQYEVEKNKYEKLIGDLEKQLEKDKGNPLYLYNKSKAEERVAYAVRTLKELEEMTDEALQEEEPDYPKLEVDFSSPDFVETVFSFENEEQRTLSEPSVGEFRKALEAISRTRGVTLALLMDKAGNIISSVSSEDFEPSDLGSRLVESLEALNVANFGNGERKMSYWVMEFKNSTIVVKPVDDKNYLVVMGRKGANFGTLKYSIEENWGTSVG